MTTEAEFRSLIGEYLGYTGPYTDDKREWRKACGELAAAIAKDAGADKGDALATQDAAWHDIEDKHVAQIEELKAENERLGAWVTDLQAGTYVTCVYCGYRYGPDDEVPTSMADVLKEHIERCPEHPMSALKADNERLRRKITGLEYALEMAEASEEILEQQIYSEESK